MLSQREVIRRYSKLMQDVKTKDYYKVDLTNRVNCYTCSKCGHVMKSRDVDAGTTPMFIFCALCRSTAHSSFYKDIAPEVEPTFEWFRPSLQECLKARSKTPHALEHVLKGGLDMRPVS